MGLFDWFRPKMSEKQLQQLQSAFAQGMQRYLNGVAIYPDYKTYSNAERYCTTDDVYSIINLLSSTAALIPFYAYQKNKDGQLEKLPEENELNVLMQAPVYGYSQFEGLQLCYLSMWLHGEVFLLKESPEYGFNAGKVKALHFVHPQNINVVVSAEHPKKIIYYQYVDNGKVVRDKIPQDEVIHVKYFNPQIGINGQEFRGLSPLTVLSKRLTRLDSNLDVSTAQMQNGGVPGIVWDKVIPDERTVDVNGSRKKAFYDYLSESTNKGAPYFAAGELGYIQLGLKLADLDVANLAKIDFKKLCNAYGVSDLLFNNDDGAKYDNSGLAMKRLYTNSVLPTVTRFRDGFNRALIKDNKSYINYDISEVPELQDDYKDMVTWLKDAYWLTLNEKRAVMKYEAETDPLFDRYLIPTGVQTLEDLQAVDPIEDTGDYGKNNP